LNTESIGERAGLELDAGQCNELSFHDVSSWCSTIRQIMFTARKPTAQEGRKRHRSEEDEDEEKPRKPYAIFAGNKTRLLEKEQVKIAHATAFMSRNDSCPDGEMDELLPWDEVCRAQGRPREYIYNNGPGMRVEWIRTFFRSHDFRVTPAVRDNVHGRVYSFVYDFQLLIGDLEYRWSKFHLSEKPYFGDSAIEALFAPLEGYSKSTVYPNLLRGWGQRNATLSVSSV